MFVEHSHNYEKRYNKLKKGHFDEMECLSNIQITKKKLFFFEM